MRTGIIGAGKVGCSLGKYFRLNNLEVTGYYDVNENLAKEAADFTATAFIKDLDTIVKESDTLFLTVPDDLKYLPREHPTFPAPIIPVLIFITLPFAW